MLSKIRATRDTYIIAAIRKDFTGVNIKILKYILQKFSQICINYLKYFILTRGDIFYIKCQ